MNCKNCGKSVEDGISFCPYCGRTVNNSNRKFVNNVVRKTNKNIFVITGFAITVIMVAVIIKSGVISCCLEKKEVQRMEKENRKYHSFKETENFEIPTVEEKDFNLIKEVPLFKRKER